VLARRLHFFSTPASGDFGDGRHRRSQRRPSFPAPGTSDDGRHPGIGGGIFSFPDSDRSRGRERFVYFASTKASSFNFSAPIVSPTCLPARMSSRLTPPPETVWVFALRPFGRPGFLRASPLATIFTSGLLGNDSSDHPQALWLFIRA